MSNETNDVTNAAAAAADVPAALVDQLADEAFMIEVQTVAAV